MKVICKLNDPDNVPLGIPDSFNFGLELEKEYLVMGIVLAEKQLWYLIDEERKPDFYPFQLFEIMDNKINMEWYFRLISEDDQTFPFYKEAIWGYAELCFDKNHYTNIIDREQEALNIYFKRKLELSME